MNNKKTQLQELLQVIKQENDDSINFLIPEFVSKKLIDYNSIRTDLLHVREAATTLQYLKRSNSGSNIVRTCLWHSIIISYGKCFTDTSKSHRTKLDISSFMTKDDKRYLTHNALIDLRHNYIAHRGDSENDLSVIFLKVPKNETMNLETSHYRIKSRRRISPTYNDLGNYVLLFNKILEEVELRIIKQGDRTHKGFLNLIKTFPLLPKYTRI